MMSKRKKLSTSVPPNTISFRGQKYYIYNDYFTLSGAKKDAKKVMGEGYKVRILRTSEYFPFPSAYALYTHPKHSKWNRRSKRKGK